MNQDIIAGRWKQLIGQASTRWGQITDADWTSLRGRAEQFFGKLQERYGLAREQALAAIDDISSETSAIAAALDADRRADRNMDSDYGSGPRLGMDNLAATPVADPCPTYIERIDAALRRFVRRTSEQLKLHPGAALMTAASVGFVVARWTTPPRRSL